MARHQTPLGRWVFRLLRIRYGVGIRRRAISPALLDHDFGCRLLDSQLRLEENQKTHHQSNPQMLETHPSEFCHGVMVDNIFSEFHFYISNYFQDCCGNTLCNYHHIHHCRRDCHR